MYCEMFMKLIKTYILTYKCRNLHISVEKWFTFTMYETFVFEKIPIPYKNISITLHFIKLLIKIGVDSLFFHKYINMLIFFFIKHNK